MDASDTSELTVMYHPCAMCFQSVNKLLEVAPTLSGKPFSIYESLNAVSSSVRASDVQNIEICQHNAPVSMNSSSSFSGESFDPLVSRMVGLFRLGRSHT
jgi:hypothetical protein